MIIVVPFSIDEPTKASWYISVTADVNGICTVTAICSPFATTDLPWDTWRRGEHQGVIKDKWPHIPARNMLDLRPNVGDPSSRFRKRVGRYSTGGARSTVGLMSRIARLKTLCVKGGTHPRKDERGDTDGCLIVILILLIIMLLLYGLYSRITFPISPDLALDLDKR